VRHIVWSLGAGALAVALALGPSVPPVRGASPSLAVTPAEGDVGTRVQIAANGLVPGTQVTFLWQSSNGSYRTKVEPAMISFYGYAYEPAQIELGRVGADAQGRVVGTFPVPEDMGGVHQIYAMAGGHEVARGQFKVDFSASMTPASGPAGAPIAITFHGLGPQPWNTDSVIYDNHFTGFISEITTHGGGHFHIRAAGAVGPHLVQLDTAANAEPMLNAQQGPGLNKHHMNYHKVWTFTVTGDTVVPPDRVEWPDPGRVARMAPVASGPGSLTLAPASGPILTRVQVSAKGLSPGAQAQVLWQTMGPGNRLTGMSPLETHPLLTAAAGPDGTLKGTFTVPDDLGGRHMIEVVQNARVVAAAMYLTKASFVAVTPVRVKAGQQFKVEIKGVGWTEIDNAVAVTYDNAYMGYACGFNSRGDVTIYITATGGPGVHLVDLYPMMFQGEGQPPWAYQVPQLTTLEDSPGLGLGIALPIFRLAVTVTP
jgi:hypothetical protein